MRKTKHELGFKMLQGNLYLIFIINFYKKNPKTCYFLTEVRQLFLVDLHRVPYRYRKSYTNDEKVMAEDIHLKI